LSRKICTFCVYTAYPLAHQPMILHLFIYSCVGPCRFSQSVHLNISMKAHQIPTSWKKMVRPRPRHWDQTSPVAERWWEHIPEPVRNLLPILTLPHEPHQEPHPRCDCPNDSWQAVSRTPGTRLERSAAFFLSHSGWHPWTLEFVGDCSLEGNAEFFAFCMGCGFHPYLQGKRTKWSPLQRNIHPTMISRGGGICSTSARGCKAVRNDEAASNLLGCWVEWEDLPISSSWDDTNLQCVACGRVFKAVSCQTLCCDLVFFAGLACLGQASWNPYLVSLISPWTRTKRSSNFYRQEHDKRKKGTGKSKGKKDKKGEASRG
jgi:hypothetical protein